MSAVVVRLAVLGPCVPCSERATCRAPCAALEALLPAEYETPREEVLSPGLARGDGYDEPFRVLHPALVDDPEPEGDAWASERTRELILAVGGASRAAELLGVGKAAVYHWAKGTRPAPQEALRALQKAVDAMAAALVPPTTPTPAVPHHDDLEEP